LDAIDVAFSPVSDGDWAKDAGVLGTNMLAAAAMIAATAIAVTIFTLSVFFIRAIIRE
jgi:hypothetical protein